MAKACSELHYSALKCCVRAADALKDATEYFDSYMLSAEAGFFLQQGLKAPMHTVLALKHCQRSSAGPSSVEKCLTARFSGTGVQRSVLVERDGCWICLAAMAAEWLIHSAPFSIPSRALHPRRR